MNGVTYAWPAADGTATYHLQTDGAGTLSWGASGTPTMDTVGDPAADVTLVYADNLTDLRTYADTNEDMLRIQGIGAFGDVSVVRIEQITGAATDGTVLEVVAADSNVDPLVVSSSGKANALVVGQNTGVVTIAGVAEGTSALVITAGDISLTDGDLNVPGGDATFAEDVSITGNLIGGIGLINYTHFDVDATGAITNVGAITSDGDITTTANLITVDGTFSGNVAITGTFNQDNVSAVTADTDLVLSGTATIGGVHIGTVGGNGNIDMGAVGYATEVVLGSGVNLDLAGGDITVVDTANTDLVSLTNNTMTTASMIDIIANATTTGKVISVTADGLTAGGVMLLLDSDAIPDANTHYIEAVGTGSDWTLSKDGIMLHSGVAETDVITVTTGDVNISDGHIVSATDVADDQSSITRDVTGSTVAAFYVNSDHTGDASPAIEINQDGNGNSTGIKIVHDGDYPAIDISAGVARTGNVIDISMTNAEAQNGLFIDGAWTGASDIGMVHLHATGAIASGASMLRLDHDTGATAASGFMLEIEDDSADGGTLYAVLIDSANNEALNVAAGTSIFAEVATFTSGIDINAGVDIDFATNVIASIDGAANDYAAGAGILTVYDDSTGQTSASYLIRGAREANGDAEDHFLLFEDASDGTAGNGDDMFYVNSGGVVYAASTVTATGGISVGNAADSFLHTNTVEISNAEIKLLRANKKELVAAPGAANFIEVVSVVLILDYGTNVLTESADNLVVQYGTSGDDITAAIEMTGFIDQAGDTIMSVFPVNPQAANASADLLNDAVELFNTGDGEFAGNAGADTTITVKITYRIHAAGL